MKRLFAKLASLFGYAPQPAFREPLMGLSAEQARAVQALKDHPSWPLFLATLDSAINLYAESLLQTRDVSALHETRGVILGLRKAVSLVDEPAHRASELAAAERRERDQQLADAERARYSLYGSPGWHPSLGSV